MERFEDWDPAEDHPTKTEFIEDHTVGIIAKNNSPDVGFERSINAYRGCEHGCAYCFARPFHEYLGMSAGLDFESKIMVKLSAPELLRAELLSPKWQPQLIAMSGVTDCYQPAERKFQLTRRCLEVLLDFRNPVGIITKNHLVTRDIDILQQLAAFNCVAVNISITTLDPALCAKMEPRASLPQFRLDAVRKLSEAGIPVGIMAAPMVPGLTDHEMPRIIQAAADAGAKFAGYIPMRLPFGVKEIFTHWLDRHFPGHKDKVLNRVRAIRGGKLNDPNFGSRLEGEGIFAKQMEKMFDVAIRRTGLATSSGGLTIQHFRRPGTATQLALI